MPRGAPLPDAPHRPVPLRRLGLSGFRPVALARRFRRAQPPLFLLGLVPGRALCVPRLPLRAHGASRGLLRGPTDLTLAARRRRVAGVMPGRSRTRPHLSEPKTQARLRRLRPGSPSARLRVPNSLSLLRGEAGVQTSGMPGVGVRGASGPHESGAAAGGPLVSVLTALRCARSLSPPRPGGGGKSPAPNPRPTGGRGKCGVRKTACPVSLGGLSPSDRGSARGRCEAGNGPRRAGVRSSRICPGDSTRRARDGRTVAEDPLVGPPPGAGWPSPGAFPSRRCAATGSGSAWKGRAEVAGGLGRQLLPLPAPRRFLGPWTKCSLRPLSPRGGTGPPAPGATVDRGGLSSVRLNRVASPGRGSAHAKKAPGVCGDVGNPPDPS
ncbi:hypothetical protein Q8A73_023961 [Channa argus]|nr:hypothetical protein Q8A73_023961 [Channa argus]